MSGGKKENILIIVLITSVLLILFGTDWHTEYSTDTIDLAERGFFALSRQFFENGRFVTALMMAVWGFFGKGIPTFYFCNWAGGLLLLGAAVFLLQRELREEVEDPAERTLIAFLLFINPFIIEYFLFIETASSFCLSMLFSAFAVISFNRFMSTGKIRFIPITLGILFAAAFSYQAVTGIFTAISLPFVYKYSVRNSGGSEKKAVGLYFRNVVTALVLYGIPLAANFLHIRAHSFNKRLEATRSSEESFNIFASFFRTMKRVPGFLKHNYAILPENLFYTAVIIVLVLSAALIVVQFIRGRGEKGLTEAMILPLINLAAIVIGISAISTASITIGAGWFMPRVVYPIGSLFGVLLLNLRMNGYSDTDGRKNPVSVALSIVIAAYLFVTMLCFTRIFTERYQMNACDRARSESVLYCIESYETKTGNKIKKIAVYNDDFSAKPYGISDEGGMTASSFATVWSDVAGINFYTGQSYERVERDPKYTEYFDGKKWDGFSEEQLAFDGDTLHLCLW